jgi:hypothetical protein
MKQYGDPKLVAIAYNWGEGNTNRWLKTGADPRMLPKETRGYLDKFMTTALASGGQVQGYAEGGEISQESYATTMKRAFGYEPFHGPAVHKYAFGGQVQHFVEGETVKGKPIPEKATSSAGNFLESIGAEDALNAIREKYYKSREFENRMAGAEDVYPSPFESLTPTERNKRIAAGNSLFNGPKNVPPMTPAEIEAANSKIMAGSSKPPRNINPKPLVAPTQEQIDAAKTSVERQAELGPAPSTNISKAGLANINDAMKALSETEKPTAPVDQMGNVTGPSEWDTLQADLRNQSAAIAKQRKEDRAYANIMAGLATMAGESPNAMTNIAKGQMTGMAYGSEARKQAAAEDARVMQMQGTVLRYKDAHMLAKEAQKDRDAFKQADLALKRQMAEDNKTAKDEKLILDKQAAKDRAEAKLKEGLRLHADSQTRKAKNLAEARYAAAKAAVLPDEHARLMAEGDKFLNDAEEALQSDPIYIKGMRELFEGTGIDFTPQKPSAPASKPLDTTGFKRVK